MTNFARVFQSIPLRLDYRLTKHIRYLQRLFMYSQKNNSCTPCVPMFNCVDTRSIERSFLWGLRYANMSLTHSLTHLLTHSLTHSGVDVKKVRNQLARTRAPKLARRHSYSEQQESTCLLCVQWLQNKTRKVQQLTTLNSTHLEYYFQEQLILGVVHLGSPWTGSQSFVHHLIFIIQ